MSDDFTMATWFNIIGRLVILPLLLAAICVVVPHWVFTQPDIDVPRTMTLIAGLTWSVTCAGFLLFRKCVYLAALGLATCSLLATWGGHLLLAGSSIRYYMNLPTVAEYAMASLWWGAYFAALFASLDSVRDTYRSLTSPDDSGERPLHPGIEMAALFAIVNLGLLAILAAITWATGGYRYSFPWIATLHLPLQTIKDAARPGMGSGGYLPGSILLYTAFGTSFQSALAWGVCRLSWAFGLIKLSSRVANERELREPSQ